MKKPTCRDCPYWDDGYYPTNKRLGCCCLEALSKPTAELKTDEFAFCGEHPHFDRWMSYTHTAANLSYGENREDNKKFVIRNEITQSYYRRLEGAKKDCPDFSRSFKEATTFETATEAMAEAIGWPAEIAFAVKEMEEIELQNSLGGLRMITDIEEEH